MNSDELEFLISIFMSRPLSPAYIQSLNLSYNNFTNLPGPYLFPLEIFGGGLGEAFASVRARVCKSGVREKKLFCLVTYEIICNYAKIKFLTWPHEAEKDLAANFHVRTQLENDFFLFLYSNVAS